MISRQRARALRLSSRLSLAAAFLLLALGGWRKVGSPEIDFGRELFAAWRISEGAVLQRDLAHLFGPLSTHINGLAFAVFGASFSTLFYLNLLCAAAVAFMTHRLAARLAGEAAAFAACAFVILVYLFHQEPQASNYNFLSPYSHEAAHATLLTLFLVCLLDRWSGEGSDRALRGAGFVYGMVLLTKPEFALAASGGALAFFAVQKPDIGFRAAGGFLAWAAALPLAFLAWFTARADFATGATALTMPFFAPFKADVGGTAFYSRYGGFDDPGGNLKAMALGLSIVAAPLALAAIAKKAKADSRAVPVAVCAAGGALAWFFGFARVPMAIPLLLSVVFVVGAMRVRAAGGGEERRKAVLTVTLAAVSLLLTLKIFLNAGLAHYGIFLTLPGAVLLISLAAGGLGDARRRSASLGVLAVAAVLAWQYLALTCRTWSDYGFTLGSGSDAMDTKRSDSAILLASSGRWLEGNLKPGETFLVLPDSPVLNYLSRSTPPTPFVKYMPPEIALFGEERMIDALKVEPPGYILIFRGAAVDYGVGDFGESPAFGKAMMDWIGGRYELFARSAKVAPWSEREVLFYRRKGGETSAADGSPTTQVASSSSAADMSSSASGSP